MCKNVLCVCVLDQWEESEQVNLTQAFYQLQGLKAGTKYRLEIRHNNLTYWTFDMKTTGPGTYVTLLSCLDLRATQDSSENNKNAFSYFLNFLVCTSLPVPHHCVVLFLWLRGNRSEERLRHSGLVHRPHQRRGAAAAPPAHPLLRQKEQRRKIFR